MKDLSEQLKEALSQIVLGEDAEGNTYHFGDEDGSEMQQGIELITALIKDNYVPKEFVEWIGFESPERLKYREIDDRWLYSENFGLTYFKYTPDELFEYWKTYIRDK